VEFKYTARGIAVGLDAVWVAILKLQHFCNARKGFRDLSVRYFGWDYFLWL
jgi:hypothetical protein